MGRIRTIKPEFPQSESVGALSRDARLLFIQLWTIADDHGRARANSRMLASLLYPYDDDAPDLMDTWLSELERQGCIRRYEVGGAHYLDIPKWSAHQKVDRPSEPKFPEYRESDTRAREPSLLDQGREGKGKEENCRKAPRRISYPPRYQAFWDGYPVDPLMSKSEGFTEWQKLSPEDQEAATAALPAFKAATAKLGPDHRVIHACRYLKKRRFDGFAAQAEQAAKIAENASSRVYVKYGTDAGDAWEAHYRAMNKVPPRDQHGGWWFDSEFPPSHVQRETSSEAA